MGESGREKKGGRMIGERMRRGTDESCDRKEEGERERLGGGGMRAVIERRREREMGGGG